MSSRRPSQNGTAKRTPTDRRSEPAAIAGDAELLRMIRRLLALPMEKRTHFLRVRLPGGGSCL